MAYQTIDRISEAVAALQASQYPVLDVRGPDGTVVAYLAKPELMARLGQTLPPPNRRVKPKDLPRAERPKQKLSKRQRDQARREKLGAPVS